jgi:hypothetical protein
MRKKQLPRTAGNNAGRVDVVQLNIYPHSNKEE